MNAKFRQWIKAEIKPFLNFTKVILYAKFNQGSVGIGLSRFGLKKIGPGLEQFLRDLIFIQK